MTSPSYPGFLSSLDREVPPEGASALVRALWHGLRGQWDAAHALAQVQDGPQAAWVHAWLHRIEGDLGNADYWYGRARQPRPEGSTRDEGLAIARSLIGPPPGT